MKDFLRTAWLWLVTALALFYLTVFVEYHYSFDYLDRDILIAALRNGRYYLMVPAVCGATLLSLLCVPLARRFRRPLLGVFLTLVFLGSGGEFLAVYLGVPQYLAILRQPESRFYEEQYVHPAPEVLAPPAQKNNLLVIFAESLENAAVDANANNPLIRWRQRHFAFNEYVEGCGTGHTYGALVGAHTGLPTHYFRVLQNPRKIPDILSDYPRGVPGLGKILKDAGYQLLLVQSGNLQFSGTDRFLLTHGYTKEEIFGSAQILKSRPAARTHYWGVDDRDSLAFFKEKISALPPDKPFFATFFTINTHGGTAEELGKDIRELHAECGELLDEFLEWFTRQPRAEQTTVWVVADHCRMAPVHTGRRRTLYNLLLNPVRRPPTTARRLSQIDLFPSLLESCGFTIKNGRLGMGTSVFSARRTLLEEFGEEELAEKLLRKNRLYRQLQEGGAPTTICQ